MRPAKLPASATSSQSRIRYLSNSDTPLQIHATQNVNGEKGLTYVQDLDGEQNVNERLEKN
jgi:hypothetical protein